MFRFSGLQKQKKKKNSDKYIQTGFVNIWDAFVGLKTGVC